MITWNRRQVNGLIVAIAAFFLFVMLSACVDLTGLEPTESEPASPIPTLAATDTPVPASTPEGATSPETTSQPEEEAASGTTDEEDVEIVVSRTPIPTLVPGRIERRVTNFVVSAGLAGLEFLGLTVDDWINLGLSVLMFAGGYILGVWLLMKLLRKAVRRTHTEFDDRFLEAVGPQLKWFIVLLLLCVTTFRLAFLSDGLRRLLADTYFVLILGTIVVISLKLIDFAVEWYREKVASEEDADHFEAVIPLLQRVGRIAVIAIALLVGLTHLGIDVTALVAALGVAGLAFSLAAQDTLSDAIAGFTILADRPFRVGDRIEISGLDTWGDVVSIGLRTTRIRTRDNRLVIVPNSTIGKNQVINYTYPDPRYRIQEDIRVGYGMDIEKTRQVIVDTVRRIEGVLPDKPVDALYVEMGDSAMIFRVRWWIESYTDTRHMFDRVNTALQKALDEAGIEMPFTTYDVNLKVDPKTPE